MGWSWAAPFWLAWLFICFLPLELWAAVKTPGTPDTFSEFVWWAFGIRPRSNGARVKARLLRQLILAGFMLSLTAHFVLGMGPLGVIVFGAMVGLVIAYATLFERHDGQTTDHPFRSTVAMLHGSPDRCGVCGRPVAHHNWFDARTYTAGRDRRD